MKVKELKEKYKGYQFIEMGYPDSIPFTELPKELWDLRGKAFDKVFDEMEVKGYEAIDEPVTCIDITAALFGGKKKPNNYYKGTVKVYLKGNEERRK